MTAVTTQSNKIVSKEVDDKALLEPSYGKNQMNFWPGLEYGELPWVLNILYFHGCQSAFPVLRSLCIWPDPCVLHLLTYISPPLFSLA